MPKELRIAVTLEIPDDIWEQADKLSAAKPIVEAFTAAVKALGGKVEAELVTPKPRGEKPDPAPLYAALRGKMPA